MPVGCSGELVLTRGERNVEVEGQHDGAGQVALLVGSEESDVSA